MIGLSLFSGIGGMDLAFEAAGGRVVAMCEIDPFCRAVLRKHWPGVPIFEDIKNLRGEDVAAPIDIIYGGPPCQPVSVAGRRRGQDDERYLWGDVFRLVADLMPRFCVFENVPGILSIATDEICQNLDSLGYSVGVCMFEAAAVGAPHRRARVFFVAYRDRSWELQQSGRVSELGERIGYGGEDVGDAEGRRRDNRRDCADIGSPAGENDAPRGAGSFVPHADGKRFAGNNMRKSSGGECQVERVCETLPDSARKRRGARRTETERLQREPCVVGDSGDVTDPDCERCEEQRCAVAGRAELESAECSSRRQPESRLGGMVGWRTPWLDGDWWRNEPDIPRIAKGIPNRVSRLKALGNIVVPAQAYPIFKAIMEVTDA